MPQPVLVAITLLFESYTVRTGWARNPLTLKFARVGPTARTSTVAVWVPWTTKPAIRMFAPVPTCARVEMLAMSAESDVSTS